MKVYSAWEFVWWGFCMAAGGYIYHEFIRPTPDWVDYAATLWGGLTTLIGLWLIGSRLKTPEEK